MNRATWLQDRRIKAHDQGLAQLSWGLVDPLAVAGFGLPGAGTGCALSPRAKSISIVLDAYRRIPAREVYSPPNSGINIRMMMQAVLPCPAFG